MRSRSRSGADSFRSESFVAVAAIWMSVAAIPTFAVDPGQPFSRYVRTHFTTDDGLPAGVVDDIQQTPDGFLWLVLNGNSLARFDGRNFQVFDEIRAFRLAVAPNGDLWVGTAKDLRRIPFDSLRGSDLSGAIPYPSINVTCLRFGRDGVLWVGTEHGLFRFDDGRLLPVGPRVDIRRIEPAANGHLLLITEQGFVELDETRIVPSSDLTAQLGAQAEVFHVMEDSSGTYWYSTSQGLARRSTTQWLKLPPYGPKEHAAFRTYEDPQSNVWVAKAEGLSRATAAGLELAVPGMKVRALYTDRDGTLWVGTNGDGLFRFRDPAVRMLTAADGLPNDVIQTVLAARDGSIWTGANCGGLTRFDGTHFRTYKEKDGLLNTCVWSLGEDAQHDLWIGTWGGGAFRLHEGQFTQFLAGEIVASLVAARDGSVWCGTTNGLVRLRNGQVRTYTKADGLSGNRIFRVFEDRAGTIFAGCSRGVDRLVGDRFENLSQVPKTWALPIGEDRSGGLFIDLDRERFGLRIEGSRVDAVPQRLGGLTETDSGELWIGGSTGIRRVPSDSFARPRPRDEPLDDELFSTPDGLAGREVSSGHPNLAVDRDGKLWIATPHGLAVLDPRRFPRTTRPSTIYVRDVTIGRNTQPAPGELLLPPGTSHVEIVFAVVEISSPEKIHLQYRLDGVDSEWLDAEPSLRAIYSNIPPGTHAFRIRASNRSGVWDRTGIAYAVRQQPHFYQTSWFLALTIVASLSAIGGVYRLRIRQVSRQLGARFDERLAERTRVARDLHDTFLQTVQGSKLVADHALKAPDDHARLLHAVEQLAGWLGRATEEGRAALNSLRTSATEKNNLAESLRGAIEECSLQADLPGSLSVIGEARDLHPIVRDEIYRIGYEAIRNACSHSRADALKVTLAYAHDLRLQVSDDGVGLDPTVSERGRDGHFGLSGMRERAERIGGKLTIDSAPNSGTTIDVIVPGRFAYRIPGSGRLKRIASVLFPD